jgi:uncharacterized membrane protein YeaQ/YmgE (transglycosylase-associated protein family)
MRVPELILVAALVVLAVAVWAGVVAVPVHALLTWLVIGLIAGALAGRLVQGKGLGCLLDIVVGLAGAILGGLIVHQLDPSLLAAGGLAGFVEDVVVAFLGAVILLCVVSLFTRRPGRRRLGGRA